jgi:hypothetical protein
MSNRPRVPAGLHPTRLRDARSALKVHRVIRATGRFVHSYLRVRAKRARSLNFPVDQARRDEAIVAGDTPLDPRIQGGHRVARVRTWASTTMFDARCVNNRMKSSARSGPNRSTTAVKCIR